MNTRENLHKPCDTDILCPHKDRPFCKLYRHAMLVVTRFLFVFWIMTCNNYALASFVVDSQDPVDIAIKGYENLREIVLFKGSLSSEVKHRIDTPYRGFALLVFEKGQQYPVILGQQSFILNIKGADTLPSFTGSEENEIFYKLLTGAEPGHTRYDFPLLMIEAKQLLESTYSVRTFDELTSMKEKFHTFVGTHYEQLQHSDMLRRLLGQYFMMHEYADFHIEGAPAGDIQVQYEKAVISGVENWLEILKVHIPEHEVLNYCVSLYYNRSMVSLAHLIVSNFRAIAYCQGNIQESVSLPEELHVTDADGNSKGVVKDFKNNAVFSFVSADCPVSMVETVAKARQLAAKKQDVKLIVAPLQQLSVKHLAMRRMISSGNMFFINDEKWRKNSLPKDIRLPLFVDIATSKF